MCTSSSAAKHSALKRKILGSSDFPLLTRRLLIGLTTGFFPVVEQVIPVEEQVIPITEQAVPVEEQPIPVTKQALLVVEQATPVVGRTIPFVAQPNLVTKQPHPIAGELITVKEHMHCLDSKNGGGESGRTPTAQAGDGERGRDYHPDGFTVWMAGGGVRGGFR